MKNLWFLCLAILFIWACRPDSPVTDKAGEESIVHVEGDTARRMDQYLTALEGEGFSGVALVAINDEVILSKGYGMADDSLEMLVTPATVFGLGSITKQFTGAAILKLEMQGKLAVTDLMSAYLEGVPDDKAAITLHHLLTHSAGFQGAIGDDYAPIGREAFIEMAMAAPLQFAPGTAYTYSNVGYSLLAAIIEKVSGQSYEVYLRDNLFLPAGMTQTGYVLPAWPAEQIATGYQGDRRWGKLNEKNWAEDGPYWHLRGNGGILSTPHDMLRWHRALLGEAVLSAEAKAKYFARHVEEGEGAGTYYGYGWAIFPTQRGTDLITHNGGNGIFFADLLRYVEEGVFIFFATNRSHRAFNRASFELARLVFDREYEPGIPALEGQELSALPDDERGQTAAALLAAIKSGKEADIRAFFDQHVSAGLTDMAPMEEHLAIFGQLHQDFGQAELVRIVALGANLQLGLRDPESDQIYLLTTEFSPMEPGKLAGLGVDLE